MPDRVAPKLTKRTVDALDNDGTRKGGDPPNPCIGPIGDQAA